MQIVTRIIQKNTLLKISLWKCVLQQHYCLVFWSARYLNVDLSSYWPKQSALSFLFILFSQSYLILFDMQHNLKSVSKFIELKKYDPLLKNELLILIKDCYDPDQIILKNNPNKAYNKLYQFQAHSPPLPKAFEIFLFRRW